MKKFQKKYILNKVTNILKSHKFIIVGSYDSTTFHLLYKEKKIIGSCQIYVPQNKVSKLAFQEFSTRIFNNHAIASTNTLLEGPIFLLATNNTVDLVQNLSKLIEAGIHIYTAIIDEQFHASKSIENLERFVYSIADIKEIVSLLKQTNIYEKPYKNLKYKTFFNSYNQLIFFRSFLASQITRFKNVSS